MRDIVAVSSRYVSAEPSGVEDDPDFVEPPVGKAFVGFTFHHAYLVFDPVSLAFLSASNPAAFTIVP